VAAYPSIDDVFRALADPSRRLLLDSLNDRNGQTLRELCSRLDMARQSVSKHLAVLEAANLVTTIRRGREKLHYLNAAPINDIGERWITRYDRGRVQALADLKRALEDAPMDKPSFVYTTYIHTTPERLWHALTDPAFTQRYWGLTFESDWAEGSTMTWHQRGVTIADPDQVVLVSEPYRRLSYTWHTFTPELTEALGLADEVRGRLAVEPRSRVTFEIEPLGELVKLTVVHDELEPGGVTVSMISRGWPRVRSDLKTLLETGAPLPEVAIR
jgi:DNA-binding transcriptional ArsR family regulator